MTAADAPALARPEQALDPADPAETTAAAAPPGPRRRRRHLTHTSPWRGTHLACALIPVVIGALIVVICWYGMAGEVTLEQQQGWMVGSFLGAAIAALGGVYWLLVGLRGLRIGQRALIADIAAVMDRSLDGDGRIEEPGDHRPEALAAGPELVTGEGMTIAHRPECPIARNKAVEPLTPTAAAERGLGGCGVCHT